ncbi:hypothetical protein [Kitasatospora cheerisanensis]|uniref:Uncharacterized protein n=1 Tax=Kitasatospora cheerisanensis KCTC 2395 TaxID=1348663 RepID=A0A066YV93_9ACTN|nr:hypothetical protein [Kitasatospora cheerisanensis]KDN83899.1 hypothetical protein KCH_45480 [Kitasatospora cheerisanensis KCTC 2395]
MSATTEHRAGPGRDATADVGWNPSRHEETREEDAAEPAQGDEDGPEGGEESGPTERQEDHDAEEGGEDAAGPEQDAEGEPEASNMTERQDGAGSAGRTQAVAVAAARAAAVLEPGLDQPVRVLGARLWLAGAALLLAVGAGAGWAVWGTLPNTMTVHAVVAHGPAPVRVSAERAGSVLAFRVARASR